MRPPSSADVHEATDVSKGGPQYHALKAGLALAPSLDAADYARLLEATEAAASVRDLKGTDRMTLIRKLRALKPTPP